MCPIRARGARSSTSFKSPAYLTKPERSGPCDRRLFEYSARFQSKPQSRSRACFDSAVASSSTETGSFCRLNIEPKCLRTK
eukprot:11191706-Lingulodinium_polyedra.AAC.2